MPCWRCPHPPRVLVNPGTREAEFCRIAESHPRVIAYTKNHNLGLEIPYRFGSVNHLGTHGRWAFAGFGDVWELEEDFADKVSEAFEAILRQHA